MHLNRRFFWAYLLPKDFVIKCAQLGTVGKSSRMPGTFGSVWGFILYVLLFNNLSPVYYLFFLIVFSYIAMGICEAAETHLMQKDPGSIVIDEFVAVPYIFIGMNGLDGLASQFGGWPIYLAGFLLFRLIDICKPFGITAIEKLNGGLACVLDDIVAALSTCILLHLILIQF